MSETPNGLRGEMAAACFDPGAYVGPRGERTTDQWRADACIAGPLAPFLAQVSALQAEVERLQKVEGEREKDAERVPSGPCWSDKPEPVPVSALRATITSRTLPAGVLQIYRGIATGTNGAFMAPADVALLIGEIDRLTHRLIEGPANPQECSELCRIAREDGDGKPCLDCHPDNFTF